MVWVKRMEGHVSRYGAISGDWGIVGCVLVVDGYVGRITFSCGIRRSFKDGAWHGFLALCMDMDRLFMLAEVVLWPAIVCTANCCVDVTGESFTNSSCSRSLGGCLLKGGWKRIELLDGAEFTD